MGVVLTQSGPGVIVTVPVGVTSGVVVVTQANCIFRGSDRDTCIIRADGTDPYSNLFNYSVAVNTLTIENCTLDCDGRADILTAVTSNANSANGVFLNNVHIIGVTKAGIAVYNDAKLYADTVEIQGDACPIQSGPSSTVTYLRRILCYGGRASYTLTDGTPNTVPGINIDGFKHYLHYFQSPTYETPTGPFVPYATGVTVATHVSAHRSFADVLRLLVPVSIISSGYGNSGTPWDRLETEDGTWGYYGRDGLFTGWKTPGSWRPAQSPSTLVTVYRLIIGRLGGPWTDTDLSLRFLDLWPDPHWRFIDGTRPTQSQLNEATRLDILRHDIGGVGVRDVDTAFHITDPAISPIVRNVYVEGAFSDAISVRGAGAVVEDCSSYLGQDMGLTMDAQTGLQTWRRCRSERAGVYGCLILGTINIEDQEIIEAGWHQEGAYGIGAAIAVGSTVTLGIKTARDNPGGTTSGNYTIPTPSSAMYGPEYYELRNLRRKE